MNKWNDAFTEATNILSIIEAKGYEAYFVGGCVRDFLLDRSIKDIDIASSALPEEMMAIFDTVIPVGLDHGTVIVRYQGTSYEVTTFRHDGTYSDKRHPDEVKFIRHIKEDLQRRDFTMNALAMNRHGKIIDLFRGKEDLKNGVIRSVGKAHDRFMEDPLRMLRGIRFTSQLGFRMEANTYHHVIQLKAEIEFVAIERIIDEITKLFQGEFVGLGVKHLKATKIYRHIPVWKKYPTILERLPKNLSAFHSLAEVIALFHYIDESILMDTWIREWKCSNKTKKASQYLYHALVYYKNNGVTKWLVYQLPKEAQLAFIHLVYVIEHQHIKDKITNSYKELPIIHRTQLNIDGHELQALFPHLRKGRWIKECIEKVEYEVVMNRLPNNKKDIKEWILCHPPEIS